MNIFDWDNWAEIFSVIRKNKLRTFLTGFSISWGIFMFCLLLSAGNGLKNGVSANFSSVSTNRIEIWARRTSKPFKGYPDKRRIKLDEKDINLLRKQPETTSITGVVWINAEFHHGRFNISGDIQGVNPIYQSNNGIEILDGQGRFLNDMDMKENRKVMVINKALREALFQDQNPIGQRLTADSLVYQVIGVYKENAWGNDYKAYIPSTTAQLLYNRGWEVDNIPFTVEGLTTLEANEEFETSLRQQLADLHIFDAADRRAVSIWNRLEDYLQTQGVFNGIGMFIWIIGIGTLLAGIISVGNIMLITVRERTREFGIRKALGARPSSILGSILMESVAITSIFGYLGMFLGVGLGELVNSALNSAGESDLTKVFRNPTIDVHVAVGAMLVLIVAGVVAGYYPALKAVSISPVEAMRDE
jgi:putative ABC transport system permease protein